MRFIRSPTKCAKIIVFSCLVTFIGLQVLGSISFLSGNESSVASNLKSQDNKHGETKDQNLDNHVNLKKLKNDQSNSASKEESISDKPRDDIKQKPLKFEPSKSDSLHIYKEHPEVQLIPVNPVPSQSGEVGQQQIRVEAGDSLAGERTHGLPNITVGNTGSKNGKARTEKKKMETSKILERIDIINTEQSVKNEDIFGAVDNNNTLAVIVVQVHDRLQYLRQLIISFSQAKDIDRTLIIFSHDVWDEEVNQLINSIDFAKILQIFYPYSIQTHSNTFPGESPNDCPRNVKKDQAERLGCTNAKWPDLYGHYREAKFTQTKHHWWWKSNRIFNELRVTKSYNGLVLFLEEDHYVAEDFLSILSLMKHERDLHYPNCDILCLGTYLKQTNYKDDHKKVELTQWLSSKHNMGMAFTRDVWNKIHLCSENFCQFDDYNWDWSLFHVSMTCLKQKLHVMLIKGPRVFHIGECGVHHKKTQCDTEKVVKKVQTILEKANSFLYPKNLVVTTLQPKKNAKLPKGNGGWGDKRDRLMCLNMSTYNSTLLHEQLGESFGL